MKILHQHTLHLGPTLHPVSVSCFRILHLGPTPYPVSVSRIPYRLSQRQGLGRAQPPPYKSCIPHAEQVYHHELESALIHIQEHVLASPKPGKGLFCRFSLCVALKGCALPWVHPFLTEGGIVVSEVEPVYYGQPPP
mgnify:CR=1 FL=1